MLFGNFFDGAIFVDASRHPAMREMAEQFHGALAMAAHGLTAAVLAGARRHGDGLVCYMLKGIPAAIEEAWCPINRVLDNKYYSTGSTSTCSRRRRAESAAAVEGRRLGSSTARWSTVRRASSARWPAWCGWSRPGTRLLVRARDDPACRGPDDLAAVAVPARPDGTGKAHWTENKNMGLLSWPSGADRLRAVLLALGRDRNAGACAGWR